MWCFTSARLGKKMVEGTLIGIDQDYFKERFIPRNGAFSLIFIVF